MNYTELVEELHQWADIVDAARKERLHFLMLAGDPFRDAAKAITALTDELDRLTIEHDLLFQGVRRNQAKTEPSEILRRYAEVRR